MNLAMKRNVGLASRRPGPQGFGSVSKALVPRQTTLNRGFCLDNFVLHMQHEVVRRGSGSGSKVAAGGAPTNRFSRT
jgi:hypothetical protein